MNQYIKKLKNQVFKRQFDSWSCCLANQTGNHTHTIRQLVVKLCDSVCGLVQNGGVKCLSSLHLFFLMDMNVSNVYSERCPMKMSGSGELKSQDQACVIKVSGHMLKLSSCDIDKVNSRGSVHAEVRELHFIDWHRLVLGVARRHGHSARGTRGRAD